MLRKENRIGHSDALRQVIRRGKPTSVPGFFLRTRRTRSPHIRFAVAIPEKSEKRAVNRNRVRRQIYGIIHETLVEFKPGFDCYLTVRKEAFQTSHAKRRGIILKLFQKARLYSTQS